MSDPVDKSIEAMAGLEVTDPGAVTEGGEPKKSKAQLKKEAKKALKKETKAAAPPKEPKKAPKPAAAAAAATETTDDPDSMFKTGFLSEVYQERALGSPGINKIITRFPPEPNGFLHIGHSKAIAINFGFARYHGGECYLRFDDTNPKGEEKQYFEAIEEMVRWLGFKPVKVTYSSDNFDELYDLAVDLVKRDGAYVCHCSQAEIKDQRGEGTGRPRVACPHRDRPIEESLAEFEAMKNGKYAPGEAALRMKQDLLDGNPQMWDLFAYRILAPEDAYHPRTGNKWRIYPTYDFTHCLCDSFESITHSLCTTEFELSRVSYEWLCDRLEVYRPMQREYGRLNIAGTVLSKRKIIALVAGGHVCGWDDPRLYTLIGLRRRGVPPGAILSFVNGLGVTKAPTNIELKRFDYYVRHYLETTVPRLMLVLDPIRVTITNLPADHVELCTLPFSKNPAHGEHTLPFTSIVYIERADFREVDSPDYFRLAPGKAVGLLKVPHPITATGFTVDPTTGLVTDVTAVYESNPPKPVKAKTFIHWIAHSPTHGSPVPAEVRVFNPLFKSANPAAHPDGFLQDLNPDSQELYPNAMIETGFEEVRRRAPWPEREGEKNAAEVGPESTRFQGMRVAYFCVDKDTGKDGRVVLNRIVSLKEDAGKA